jgi:hypothetical protein
MALASNHNGNFGFPGIFTTGTVAIKVPLLKNWTVAGPVGARPPLCVATVAVKVTMPPEVTTVELGEIEVAVGAVVTVTVIAALSVGVLALLKLGSLAAV